MLLTCQAAAALTIYRIGGSDQPPPDLDYPFEFVRVPWSELDERQHGHARLVDIQPQQITSVQLSSKINTVPSLGQRGGGIKRLTWRGWQPIDFPFRFLTDGDARSALIGGSPWLSFQNVFNYTDEFTMHPSVVWNFDLGGAFELHRIRFYPRSEYRFARPVERFLVGLGEGNAVAEQLPDYSLGPCPTCGYKAQVRDFKVIYRAQQNLDGSVDLELPRQVSQQILFQAQPNTRGQWEIAEFEIYADGYAKRCQYTTNVIDLQAPAILGNIFWSGDQPPNTRIEMRGHAGDQPDPNIYLRYTFRDSEITRYGLDGRRLDQDSYAQLESGERAGTRYNSDHWSGWSPRLVIGPEQTPVAGDRLRRYIQLQANLHSIPSASPRLHYIQFSTSPPIADRLLGNIEPRAVEAGTIREFTYTLTPTIVEEDQGFDRLIVETPGQLLDVLNLRLSGQTIDFNLEHLDAHRFEISFPRIGRTTSGESLEIDFSARVFRFGTPFSGRVADSSSPFDLIQPIAADDSNSLSGEASLKVDLLALRRSALLALEVSPAAITPNGDGINDYIEFAYTLINLEVASSVELAIYDLTGRRLATIEKSVRTDGRYTTRWDGRDNQGRILVPGLYVLQLTLETDQGTDHKYQPVSVVY